jgi:hypothetical protein
MIGAALLASWVLTAGLPIPPQAWVKPGESFRGLTGFRVRVDVHSEGQVAAALGQRVQQQIQHVLIARGIQVVEAPSGPAPTLDGTGALILDVHARDAAGATALAWSLHASQIVHLRTGAWAFASTWEVGDLLYAPAAVMAARLRDSLQPALDEFCELYLASRAVPPEPPPPAPPPAPPEATPGDTAL